MNTALLQNLTQSFAANRAIVSKAIRELYETNPAAFLKEAAVVLRTVEDSPGTRFVLTVLSSRPDFLRFLCDSRSFTPAQSAGLVRQMKAQDARVEWKVANMVARLKYSDAESTAFAAHCMEVLSLLCEDAATLPALRELLNCPSPRVRSKAALLIGHISRNPQWAKLTDVNQDSRVVANAVESVWGLDTPVAKEVFRDAVISSSHRVAVNGAVGLYLARELEAIVWLYSFSRHEQCDFRAAGAWGMGRTADPRFLKALDTLSNDPEESVRTAALQASALLVQRLSRLKESPEISMEVAADFRDGEHTVRVTLASEPQVSLDALHFSISNGPTPVEEYTLAKHRGLDGRIFEFHFHAPPAISRLVNVELCTDGQHGEGAALETGEEVKPLAEILRKLR